MNRNNSLLSIFSCWLLFACMNPPAPFTEKKIIVGSKATETIPEINLSITNNGCGRKWISEDDKQAFERAYCDLVFKRNGVTVSGGGDSKPVFIGDLRIDIEKINPWGREEDSVPPGGCRLLIKRVEGR